MPRQPDQHPWGTDNRQRGAAHAQMAHMFAVHFGLDGEVIPIDAIDAYLCALGHVTEAMSKVEKNHARGTFLRHVRSASISQRMKEHGFAPFDVHCLRTGWRLESIATAVVGRRPAKKMKSQAQTSARRQRHIMQVIDQVNDREAYAMAAITGQMTQVLQKVTSSMDTAMEEAHGQLHTIFGQIAQLEQGVFPTPIPQLTK